MQIYATVLSIIATVLAPSVRDVLFTSITYLCLCFIKVIVLAPFSVCFSIIAAYLFSCSFMICVLLATAMDACLRLYCIVCGSKDVMQCRISVADFQGVQ